MTMRPRLSTPDVRAFLARDWSLPERLQRAHARQLLEEGQADEFLFAVEHLRAAARLTTPDWPSARDRAEDLTRHIRLRSRLARFADWQRCKALGKP